MVNFMSWELAWGLGVIVLGAVMGYGYVQYLRRDKRNDAVTEAATRMEYDEPEAYAHGGREALKEEVRPSR